MDNRLTIYVSSPDSYADVFDVFLKGFRKYWNDCPYDFIFTTNTYSYDGITCICNHQPGDSWVERTIAALPQIKSKYILLMCDDIIINKKVNNHDIERILDYMDNHEIRFCRMSPIRKGERIPELPILNAVNKRQPYAINLQIGIFRKDLFVELLGDGTENAWEIENWINKDAACAKDELFMDVVTVNQAVIPFVHGVMKGLWIRSAIRFIQEEFPDYVFSRAGQSIKDEIKVWLMGMFGSRLSPKSRVLMKRCLRCLGVRFVTDV